MSKKPSKKRRGKGINIDLSLWEQVSENKDRTGVPIQRFVEDALKAALAR